MGRATSDRAEAAFFHHLHEARAAAAQIEWRWGSEEFVKEVQNDLDRIMQEARGRT